MAKLENNNENEDKKSVAKNLGDQVQKTVQEASELASDAINHPIDTAQEFGKQAAKDITSYSWWAKLLLILFWTVLSIVVLVFIAINLPVTKRWAADQALQIVNRDFKAEMSTESVEVDFFGDVTIKGLKIKDYKGLEFIKVKEFIANSDWLSLAGNIKKNNSLSFNGLTLKNADIKVITYKGDSISNFIRFTNLFNSGKKSDPNKPPFQLNSRLNLIDSKVSIVNLNSPGEKGKWLTATNVNLRAPQVKVEGINVFAQINNFSFVTKRWGKSHFVETFSTELTMNKDFLFLKDLTLNTDHSLLQGNIKFNLNDGKWTDFADRVRWDMDLALGSQLSGYDISYFVTNWNNYIPFNISGKMNGPLNKFTLDNFLIRNPDVNIATRKMSMTNLLKGNFNIETNSLSADFTYKDLKKMMPTFIASKMKNFADDFGKLKYNGTARVTPKQVYVKSGNLMTGIGQAKISDFSLTDYSTALPKYVGYAEVKDLNTSVITKNKAVGLISGKFNLNGQSFDVNTMRLSTKSQISSIAIMNKEINNITLDGLLDHKKYNGLIVVNDEQAKATVKGLIDFSTSRISADVNANVSYLNMSYFTGKSDKQIVSGEVNGKLAMTTLNDLTLDVDASNLNFATATQKYTIPSAKLKTFIEGGKRTIDVIAPGAVSGKISGKYNLADLANMVQNGLSKILVGPPPRTLYRGQSFTMNFDVQQGLVNYFLPDLKLPQGATVEGSYDGNSNNLILNLDAASLKYVMTKEQEITDADKALASANPAYKINSREVIRDSAMIDSLMVRINTANLDEQILAKIGRINYNKNILKDVQLTGKNDNNTALKIATTFKHGSAEDELDDNLKSYAINLNQSSNAAGDFVFRFEPTEVSFNDVKWTVDTSPELDHQIIYRKKTSDFEIKNLRIYSDSSSLTINESTFKSAKDFYLDAEVKDLAIEKLLEMQSGGNPMQIKGLANGNLKIKMDKNTLQPLVDLTVDDIMMNGNDMGDLTISATNSFSLNVYDVEVKVTSAGVIGNNNLNLTGTVNNNTSTPTIDLTAELRDFDIAFTQQFVQSVFGNMRGKATGDLKISGTMKNLDYNGDISLKQFGLKLLFTGVDYSFDDTVIPLSRGLAILNNIGVHDGRSNSKGNISGAIQFETLSSMGVNLVMRADNLLMLSTTQADYDLFWGRVYGQGDLYIDGPVSGLSLSTPNMKALNGSTFTFNSSSTSGVEEFKMLRFLKEGKDGLVTLEEQKKKGANMNLDFSLAVDKGTTVNVLVGDDVGNISVKGVAEDLRFQMSRQGNIALNGSYMVDSGTFVSKAILNRTFQIQRNSSIRWDGDAMTPALDIKANYVRMVSNVGEYLNIGQLQPVSVLLQANISNTLSDPKIDLNVTALDVSSQVKETLAAKLNQTEGENVLQFGSVLLLNSFNVSNSGGVDFDAVGVAESSGYNLLLKQLGSVFNTMSSEFQIDLNYVRGDQFSNTGDRANAGVSFDLSPKITVKTGLGIPLTRTEGTQQNFVSGEGSVEYDLSKKNDGTLVLRGYSKPTNIGLGVGTVGTNGSANQAYGAGIVYSKSFNSLFKRKRKDKKTDVSKEPAKTDSVRSDAK
ncbi:hypothetical protein ASG01_12190 [Chryseobacterium sp. Leaf180]|uniref:translocation/assembly module TamB domain-containing protein n=1 Tax=Chryseobacterium sp. Leaf180 TaxID=1736289 RepID=UPI0006F656BD|nr:hypothetical protein [Chryseobacterium sp. Leaf180]KQR92652.1 hypothetical protein ASG01_12190 [Chryseobacterium sp. Leaf180]